MTKTLNQLGEATDLETPDLLLARDTSTGDDKRITLNNSRFTRHGLTESVTLSTGTLTIPVGMSTIKLPTSVWDGSSNITISAIEFEDGVQPAVGYEFSVVVPKTTTAGSLTTGALGNEVLIQDGASIAVEANNNADLPCYPNAADNPGSDPVQFAAPYYRLDFRVDEYDGNGDPVVSLVRLPDAVSGSNDRGAWMRQAGGASTHRKSRIVMLQSSASECQATWEMPASFIDANHTTSSQLIPPTDSAAGDQAASNANPTSTDISTSVAGQIAASSVEVNALRNTSAPDFLSGDEMYSSVFSEGEWY